jgi:hypothetical protein
MTPYLSLRKRNKALIFEMFRSMIWDVYNVVKNFMGWLFKNKKNTCDDGSEREIERFSYVPPRGIKKSHEDVCSQMKRTTSTVFRSTVDMESDVESSKVFVEVNTIMTKGNTIMTKESLKKTLSFYCLLRNINVKRQSVSTRTNIQYNTIGLPIEYLHG